MDLSNIKIETPRLLLVSTLQKYAEQIFLEYREPVTTYMNYGPPKSLAALEERITQTETDMKAGLVVSLAVLLKESGEFLGRFVLEDIDQKNPEIGGWLKVSAHGHHYGQEAATALKNWADQNLSYEYLVWPCAALNTPSRKLAESLGGKVEKEYVKKTAQGKVLEYVEYWIARGQIENNKL